MKLVADSTPVQRSRSLRSQPYDLRRRVLVNNFLKEQPPVKKFHRPPTPRIPYELQPANRKNNTVSTDNYDNEVTTYDTDTSVGSDNENTDFQNVSMSPMAMDTKTNEDILYLLSRRLRLSETSRLRQPCRKSRRPVTLRRKKMLAAESQEKLFPSSPPISRNKGLLRSGKLKRIPKLTKKMKVTEPTKPIRSYPTFEKLNEICSCDSATYKKTLSALSIKTEPKLKTPEVPKQSKVKRSSSLRRSISKLLKPRSSPTHSPPSPKTSPPQNRKARLEKRQSFISKLFSPLRNHSKDELPKDFDPTVKPASITRSTSLRTAPMAPGAPKLRRRANSVRLRCVRLSNDAF